MHAMCRCVLFEGGHMSAWLVLLCIHGYIYIYIYIYIYVYARLTEYDYFVGMDQRKVNMLAREYAADKKMRFKPIIISHHMLMGLKEGQEKMSKSDPNSAIFMEDR